jgi:hypothetical protein
MREQVGAANIVGLNKETDGEWFDGSHGASDTLDFWREEEDLLSV